VIGRSISGKGSRDARVCCITGKGPPEREFGISFGRVHDEINVLLQSYTLKNQPQSRKSAVVKILESSLKKESEMNEVEVRH
jgi:hypothetical protein